MYNNISRATCTIKQNKEHFIAWWTNRHNKFHSKQHDIILLIGFLRIDQVKVPTNN